MTPINVNRYFDDAGAGIKCIADRFSRDLAGLRKVVADFKELGFPLDLGRIRRHRCLNHNVRRLETPQTVDADKPGADRTHWPVLISEYPLPSFPSCRRSGGHHLEKVPSRRETEPVRLLLKWAHR